MKRMSAGDRAVNFVFYLFLIILCILCAYPVWYTLVASISGPTYVNSGAFILIPRDIQFAAYKYAFNQPQLWRGYGNTIMYTVCGTMLALFICLPAGYSLSRKDLPFRGLIMALFVFTMYFSGGLIPTYLLYKDIGLHDSLWVMILPSMFSAYYILVMRNFLTDNLVELEESAKLDGANDYIIAFRIFLPLAKPIIATIALWSAVGQWNAWYAPMIYITTPTRQVMQVILRRMLIDAQTAALFDDGLNEVKVSEDSVKAVSILITILPIICTYPFAQKYFIKGLTSGAVKG